MKFSYGIIGGNEYYSHVDEGRQVRFIFQTDHGLNECSGVLASKLISVAQTKPGSSFRAFLRD